MRLDQVLKHYEVGFRHNPKQFYPNSFEVEIQTNKLVVVAIAKKYIRKRFRVVGVVKRVRGR